MRDMRSHADRVVGDFAARRLRIFLSVSLWAGAGGPEGVHAGGRWGPMARRRRRFFGVFFLFFAIFYLFSWEFGVLAAMLSRLATACRRS